jgi:hypothetical protein
MPRARVIDPAARLNFFHDNMTNSFLCRDDVPAAKME